MTRDELFERYVADTLDEEALAELARLREEDVEFAAQFDADLVATGKFRDAEGGVERIEKGNEGGTGAKDLKVDEDGVEGSDQKEGRENDENRVGPDTSAPKRPRLITEVEADVVAAAPKLIMGTSAEMPKALQFLGVGEEPPAGFYDKPAAEVTAAPEVVVEVAPGGQGDLPVPGVQSQPISPVDPPAPPEVMGAGEAPLPVAEICVEEPLEETVGGGAESEVQDGLGAVAEEGAFKGEVEDATEDEVTAQEAIHEEMADEDGHHGGEEQDSTEEPREEDGEEVMETAEVHGVESGELVEEPVAEDEQDEEVEYEYEYEYEVIEEEVLEVEDEALVQVPRAAVPPPPPPPPSRSTSPSPVATVALQDSRQPQGGQARPLQAQLLPPEPYDQGYGNGGLANPYGQGADPVQGYGYAEPHPGTLQGHSPPQRLRSASKSNPTVFIVLAVILMVGIGGALFFGLTRKPPGPPEGDGVIAKVDSVDGEVVITRELGRQSKLQSGFELREGDVITVREGSARVAYVEEETYLHIRSGSEVTLGKQKDGKQLRLGLGELTVEAAPQPVGKPMVIRSMNAKITLKGTRVTVRSLGKETLVEVAEGSVQVDRSKDGAMVQVRAGGWTRVGEQALPQAWEFLAGVNLNGGEVAVDGGTWMSHTQAQSAGLKVQVAGKDAPAQAAISPQQPLGYVAGPGLRGMLMSKVSVNNAKLSIKWPQENGRYQVFVWMMEDGGNSVRSLRLNVMGKPVAKELGKEQTLGAWNRFGPYVADVKDGSLDLLLSPDSKFQNKEPHLSGFAIYRLAGTGPPVEPQKARGTGVLEVDSSAPGEPGRPPAVVPTVPD